MSSLALVAPIRRVRRWVPPQPGIKPILISVCPMRAFSEAMRKSHDIATSRPPPSA